MEALRFSEVHGVKTQENVLFIVSAVRPSVSSKCENVALLTSLYTLKTSEGVAVQLHTFLTSVLELSGPCHDPATLPPLRGPDIC